jgi:hypothetical protein
MKKFSLFALLIALVLTVSGVCFAGDGSDYRQLQETAVFFNNSGSTISSGDVVILDTAGTGVTAGSTLGAYVKIAPASADSVLVVGVVGESQSACLDQTPVIVVTKGPVDTFAADSSDAVTIDTAVGTSVVSGYAGGGTNLGIALEAGDGTDSGKLIVWVAPTGAD